MSFTPEQAKAGKAIYNYGATPHQHEELHGLSVFYKREDGSIYHTYSTYARGVEILAGALKFLDLVPKGRNETDTMNWVRHHDRYDPASESKPSENCGCK